MQHYQRLFLKKTERNWLRKNSTDSATKLMRHIQEPKFVEKLTALLGNLTPDPVAIEYLNENAISGL